MVVNRGLDFDGATLRGWEYGWTGRPDPLRLLALAAVYQKSVAEVMSALAAARGIGGSDLIRHAGTGQHSASPKEVAVVPATARVQQDRRERDVALEKEIRAAIASLTGVAERLVETRTPRKGAPRRSRGHRKTG